VSVATVRESLRRIYTFRMQLGEFDPPQGNTYRDLSHYGTAQLTHFGVALEGARQSLVLLKNTAAAAAVGGLQAAETPRSHAAEPVLPFAAGKTLSLALIGTHLGEKKGFLIHLYIKVIFLPRQARDKHRENSKKACFLEGFNEAIKGNYAGAKNRPFGSICI